MDVKRSVCTCADLCISFREQQIAFKNLVQRNQASEASPPPGSVIQLPFIILNTDVHTVIDCSISSDKYESFLFSPFLSSDSTDFINLVKWINKRGALS